MIGISPAPPSPSIDTTKGFCTFVEEEEALTTLEGLTGLEERGEGEGVGL